MHGVGAATAMVGNSMRTLQAVNLNKPTMNVYIGERPLSVTNTGAASLASVTTSETVSSVKPISEVLPILRDHCQMQRRTIAL